MYMANNRNDIMRKSVCRNKIFSIITLTAFILNTVSVDMAIADPSVTTPQLKTNIINRLNIPLKLGTIQESYNGMSTSFNLTNNSPAWIGLPAKMPSPNPTMVV